MSTGLFDSPPLPLERVHPPLADTEVYRSLSGAAIAAVCVALLGPLAFVNWSLIAVPFMGLVLAGVALRDVTQRSDAVTGKGLAIGALAGSAVVLAAAVSYHAVVYYHELPEGFERIHYGLLQPLPGDPPTAIPESAVEVNGRNVLLKGYIYPGTQQTGLTQFILCRDQGDCCFGGDPKLTDRVLVRLSDPKGIAYTQGLVKVAGRFRVEAMGVAELGGGVVYHIDGGFTR